VPRPLALLLTIGFVYYLFRLDGRRKWDVSPALWIPLTWVLIVGSRPISVWLSLMGIQTSSSLEDGSPVDRTVTLGLIVVGVYVLRQRRVELMTFIRENGWLSIFLLYGFLAVFWSDFPFVSFKRWIKAIGEPIVALVLLTEANRQQAFAQMIKRATIVLMPFSIMLVKYFPEIGKRYSAWGGGESGGVTGGKNALGRLCLVLGFFLFCHFLQTRRLPASQERKNELWLTAFLLWMVWWNMIESASSTALVALVVGMLVVWLVATPVVSHRFVGSYAVGLVITLFMADVLFNFWDHVLTILGEDATLTGRTDLWADLLAMDINPVVGAGFESFWMGERLEHIWKLHWWQPNEAHNGFLEVYLNLGLLGLVILVCVLIATYRKCRRTLLEAFETGRMRLGFLAAVLLFNWPEAGFRPMGLVFFMFYTIAIDYPERAIVTKTANQVAPPPVRKLLRGINPRWRPAATSAGRVAFHGR
jgi:exopolysaccharide production protein ExoQ